MKIEPSDANTFAADKYPSSSPRIDGPDLNRLRTNEIKAEESPITIGRKSLLSECSAGGSVGNFMKSRCFHFWRKESSSLWRSFRRISAVNRRFAAILSAINAKHVNCSAINNELKPK